MSAGWKNGQWELFKCPICGCKDYVPVKVQRPSGTWYTTPFYECFGCSVMFRDPVSFCGSRLRQGNPVRAPDGGFNRGTIKRESKINLKDDSRRRSMAWTSPRKITWSVVPYNCE